MAYDIVNDKPLYNGEEHIVLYPGDIIEGIDVLQFGTRFKGIIINVEPRNVYTDYGYDQLHTSVYVEHYHRVFVMYEDGLSLTCLMNLHFVKDLVLLYRK